MKNTLLSLIESAFLPLGKTMYIWGGGWNEEDNGSGIETRSIGVSPNWEFFFKDQTKNYNFKNYLYKNHLGLDCSGFIGFCVYNAINSENGKNGYVTNAKNMTKMLSSFNFGSICEKESIKDYKIGDIMSSENHVYMVLGECSDTSLLLIHSSPNGVQINGTCTKDNNFNSIAAIQSEDFMNKHYPEWSSKYKNTVKNLDYLTNYTQMRWYLDGKGILSDPEKLQFISGDKILQFILMSAE